MRTAFDEQLKQLRQELIGMSGECEDRSIHDGRRRACRHGDKDG